MDDERRATWIRRLILLLFIGGGVTAGLLVKFPEPSSADRKEASKLDQVDPANFEETISAKRLTVINILVEGQADAENLQTILEQLEEEEKYGDRVGYAELDVVPQRDMAAAQGVVLEGFTGQLDFYAAGEKLGSLKGPADRPKVEAEIERYLAGLVMRYGTGWLPEVEGLQRTNGEDKILDVQPADPAEPVPGLQRSHGPKPPPGMEPASPDKP